MIRCQKCSLRWFAVCCMLALLLAGCKGESAAPIATAEASASTLASLKRIGDYPLYTMTCYGDYGFEEYLRTGTRRPLRLVDPSASLNSPWGCTCFASLAGDSARLLGRNFDWQNSIPLLLFTKPPGGYASVSMVDLQYFGYSRSNLPDAPENREALLGTPYLPFDGMNEKGVAIGMMAVNSAQPPYNPDKVTIGEIEVIRLVLDYAATVDQAIELIGRHNVRIENPPIHYLLADRTGRAAVLEFVDGRLSVLRNTDPWEVSTNFIITGSSAPDGAPCWRYNAACSALRERQGSLTRDAALSLLQQVSQSHTMWSVLYNMSAGRLDLAVGRQYSDVVTFSLTPGM